MLVRIRLRTMVSATMGPRAGNFLYADDESASNYRNDTFSFLDSRYFILDSRIILVFILNDVAIYCTY